MLNLLLLHSPDEHVVKTLHLDERTGDMYTRVSKTNNKDDLDWLKKSNEVDCTLTNYDVVPRSGGSSFELCFACDSVYDFDGGYDGEDYKSEQSLLGLFRELVLHNAKVRFEGDVGEEFHSIAGLRGTNKSFGLNLPIVTESFFESYRWSTIRLLSNDPLNAIKEFDKIKFVISKSKLERYEDCINRISSCYLKEGDKQYKYDYAYIVKSLPLVTEKPICFPTVRVIGSLQLLLDAYALFLPIISAVLFEGKEIESTSSYPSAARGHGGFVEIKSNFKIGEPLRERFKMEVEAVYTMGCESSTLYRDNCLFKLFLHLWDSLQESFLDHQKLYKLWKGIRTSNALITILMLEAKTHLFCYDQHFLTLLSQKSMIETGIPGYTISIKPGGPAWRPV